MPEKIGASQMHHANAYHTLLHCIERRFDNVSDVTPIKAGVFGYLEDVLIEVSFGSGP